MSTPELKNTLHSYIENIEDKKVLEAVRTLLKSALGDRKADLWDSISDEEKEAVEAGLRDAKAGRVHSHEDVMKAARKKLKR